MSSLPSLKVVHKQDEARSYGLCSMLPNFFVSCLNRLKSRSPEEIAEDAAYKAKMLVSMSAQAEDLNLHYKNMMPPHVANIMKGRPLGLFELLLRKAVASDDELSESAETILDFPRRAAVGFKMGGDIECSGFWRRVKCVEPGMENSFKSVNEAYNEYKKAAKWHLPESHFTTSDERVEMLRQAEVCVSKGLWTPISFSDAKAMKGAPPTRGFAVHQKGKIRSCLSGVS